MSVLPSPREPPLHSPLSPSSTGSVTLPHTARPRHTPVLSHGYNTVVAVHLQGLQETLDSVKVEWEGQTGHSGDKVGLADLTGLTRTDTAPLVLHFLPQSDFLLTLSELWRFIYICVTYILILQPYQLFPHLNIYFYTYPIFPTFIVYIFIYLAKGNKFLPS